MKQFKYPISIHGTRVELNAIATQLKNLGYKDAPVFGNNGLPWIVTNIEYGWFCFNETTSCYNIIEVSASNPDLVLALAAMVDDDKLYVGEYVVAVKTTLRVPGTLSKVTKVNETGEAFNIDDSNDNSYDSNWGPLNLNFFRKATKEEIINHFTMNPTQTISGTTNMNWGSLAGVETRKIIGYKLKDSCKRYEVAASRIAYPDLSTINKFEIGHLGYSFIYDSDTYSRLSSAGVLDLWFEPVYEAKEKIVNVKCESGDFDVTVTRDSIVYSGTKINISVIRNIANAITVPPVNGWVVNLITKIDIGCKKGISIDSIEEILRTYDSYN